jgi:signal transduction histidine kinase
MQDPSSHRPGESTDPPGPLPPRDASPSSPEPEGGRETLRILRRDPGGAIERLRARITGGEADERTWHNLAIALDRSGERSAAVEAAEEALRRAPDSVPTLLLLGILLRQADRAEDALDRLDRAAELEPGHPRLPAIRGVARFHRGEHEAARAELERAVEVDPRDTGSWFNLTLLHVATKDFPAAQECIERLIGLRPDRAAEYHRFLIELGEVRALDETLTQAHRIKNLLGVAGDRLRRFHADHRSTLDRESEEDLAAIRDDLGSVYEDMVGLLGVIRPRPTEFAPATLRRILDRIGFVAMTRARGVAIDVDVDADLPELHCDVEKLQEGLLNLVLNAIDAVVERHGERAERIGRVRIHARAVGEQVEIFVADNGGGVPEGDLDRIFGIGFTTKRLGSGIGLAHTRRTIEEHGGRVEVRETGPTGTTFRIELPLRPRPTQRLMQARKRARLLADPRELLLDEPGIDLGL